MQPEDAENQTPKQSPSEFLTMGLVDKFALKVGGFMDLTCHTKLSYQKFEVRVMCVVGV